MSALSLACGAREMQLDVSRFKKIKDGYCLAAYDLFEGKYEVLLYSSLPVVMSGSLTRSVFTVGQSSAVSLCTSWPVPQPCKPPWNTPLSSAPPLGIGIGYRGKICRGDSCCFPHMIDDGRVWFHFPSQARRHYLTCQQPERGCRVHGRVSGTYREGCLVSGAVGLCRWGGGMFGCGYSAGVIITYLLNPRYFNPSNTDKILDALYTETHKPPNAYAPL